MFWLKKSQPNTASTSMKLLIDADLLIHRATKAVEREEIFGEDHHVLYSSFEEAKEKFHRVLSTLLDDVKACGSTTDGYELYVSGPNNWRKDVWSGYKANRKDRKPLAFSRLKEYVLDLGANMVERLEADDLLAIDACAGKGVIASVDKDFLSVPAPFLRLSVDMVPLDLINTTPEQARWHHFMQTLAGDQVDGYKGCPRFGPKTTAKWLDSDVSVEGEVQAEEVEDLWADIVGAFQDADLDETEAMTNATMAHIMHPDDAPRPWLLPIDVICKTL